jgi:Ca2+-transporting ATPase
LDSNRRLDNGFNILEGVWQNKFFMFINVIMVGGQILIVFVGGRAFSVTRLNGPQWGYSIVLGALSLPFAIILRLIPDRLIGKLIPPRLRPGLVPEVVVTDSESAAAGQQPKPKPEEPPADFKDDLGFIKTVRGGRVKTLKFRATTIAAEFRDASGYDDRLVGAISGVSSY